MKCQGRIIKKRKKRRCNKKCHFIYCKEHWKKNWKLVTGIIVGSGLLFGLLTDSKTILGWFKSEHQEYIETHYLEGLIAPIGSGTSLTWHAGNVTGFQQMPVNGVDMDFDDFGLGCLDTATKKMVDQPFIMDLKRRNGRFVFSLKITDLKTGATIVDIKDNAYQIRGDGVNNYFSDKTFFHDAHAIEIKDHYDKIAFCAWIDSANDLQIRGYFVGTRCTVFVSDHANSFILKEDPDYEEKSLDRASILQPKFILQ